MPARTLTGRDRLEATLTLALLPIGVLMLAAAIVGLIAVVALGIDTALFGRMRDGALVLWCLFAAAVSVRNVIGSLKALSAFSWRGHFVTLLWSAAVVLVWPRWWIA